MSLNDDLTTILRAELGARYETETLARLKTAYLNRTLLPKLILMFQPFGPETPQA